MTDKEKFISEKMRTLVGDEKYSRAQAYQIAISMYNKKQKAQQGVPPYSAQGAPPVNADVGPKTVK